MGRPTSTIALVALLATAVGCERGRTRNSSGNVSNDEGPMATSANVYRFVGVEKALRDARKAAEEQRWEDALAAAQALLKQDPNHVEAKKIADEAEIEARSYPSFVAFQRAAVERNATVAGASYQKIDAASRYHELGREEYERLREAWASAREGEAQKLALGGRCRDAHRVARLASDSFPEVRPRLDAVASDCRPASGQDVPEPDPPKPVASEPTASLEPHPTAPLEKAPGEPPAIVVTPPAPAASAPTPTPVAVAPTTPAPAPATPAPAFPVPTPVVTPLVPVPMPVVPVPPPGPAKARFVAAMELEKNRIAGEKRPSLPAGARMIAIRDQVPRITVGVALCVRESGEPSVVDLVKPSAYDDANEKIVADIRKWRFKPYLVDGKPAAVCTRLVLIYLF